MAVTDQGYQRPTQAALTEEARLNFVSKFTVNGNEPATDPESFFGLLSSIIGFMRNEHQEALENLYFSLFVSTASGAALDRQATPSIRNAATFSEVTLTLNGTPGTIIPINTQFQTEDNINFNTTVQATIGGMNTIDVVARAVVAGPSGNVPVGAIRFIPSQSIISGLNTVTNAQASIGGGPIESDADFRQRTIDDRKVGRTSSLLAIENVVRAVENVQAVLGFENVGETTDSEGRPPGSVEIVVRGGLDADIAAAIFNRVGAGVETHGTESVQITDEAGDQQTVEFSRVTTVTVWAEVTLTVDSTYDTSLHDDIVRQAILDYIGGVNPSSVESEGAEINENIFSWKCEGSLFELTNRNAIPGIQNVSVLLGLSAMAVTETVINITATQEATTSFPNIDIPAPTVV